MDYSKTSSIVYVVSQYPAISHTFILGEVNGLKSKGLNVHVTSINYPDRPYEKLTSTEQAAYESTTFVKPALINLPFYFFKALLSSPKGFFTSLGKTLKYGLRYPRALIKHFAYWLEAMVVADQVKLQQAQQIHAHFSTQGCSVAMLASAMTHVPFSLTVHGPDEFYQASEQHLKDKFLAANFIVCISDFARSQVMKFSQLDQWPKLYVNNLGVDASLFHPIKQKNNLRPVLLCIGRLVNAKGQGILIEAAKILVERDIDFEIRFVGDGPNREALENFTINNQLQDYITFLGKVNHDQIQVLQREANIFVLPSFAEGIPIALMEAMASGTPCVTTHITGILELLTHEYDGLLVHPGNAVMLANALQRLLDDDTLCKYITQNALLTVREKWCIHKSNKRLANLFIQQFKG